MGLHFGIVCVCNHYNSLPWDEASTTINRSHRIPHHHHHRCQNAVVLLRARAHHNHYPRPGPITIKCTFLTGQTSTSTRRLARAPTHHQLTQANQWILNKPEFNGESLETEWESMATEFNGSTHHRRQCTVRVQSSYSPCLPPVFVHGPKGSQSEGIEGIPQPRMSDRMDWRLYSRSNWSYDLQSGLLVFGC